ncbi:ATP-dependent helicase HrpB [Corynebacterium callunae]|uniref:ATP-dependent helicase HrpB n=1 Tax=Corynebacterium callunae TaxID=1721 RepID=UPI001FFF8CFF|nr:ATP-dependent helicase HrpB [Corynebacterium callunae]MCK2199566.1 ATP-dependent helicase HrpB [Corynebacterium callunae]
MPAASLISQLHAALDRQAQNQAQNLVIQAPPGTGKTTVIPPVVANVLATQQLKQKVLVTAPRRVAVRAAARRLAHLDSSALGDKVGYSVRGDHVAGSQVQFATPGVLVRQLLQDPELAGVGAVIIDEVHERQLDTDLLLGMLTELSQLRDDFSLIAMSATVDAELFAQLLGAQVLSAEAPLHPLEITYRPAGARLGTRGVERSFLEHIAQVTHEATINSSHSALVFVPGVSEIEWVITELQKLGHHNVFALHGRLTPQEQDLALSRSDEQRIIVSTPVAESSLTVPGVRIVVDSGLTRMPKRDAARGMTGLITASCAQSAAQQRAGRAGREGPGEVIRCYSAEDFAHFARFNPPEISVADLTQAALWLAAWGTPIAELPLLSAPPETAWTAAIETLSRIGALQGSALTPLGKRLSTLPLPPHFGASLLRFGLQAAPILAVVADSPQGDVAKQKAAPAEVKRLARLAPKNSGTATAGQIVGVALPQLIARREGENEYLLTSGTRAILQDKDLAGAPWLAIAAINRSNNRALIRAAARISEADALEIIGVEEITKTAISGGKVQARKVRAAGAIELSVTAVKPQEADAAAAVAAEMQASGLDIFEFSAAARSLRDRLRFLYVQVGAPWPDIDKADPQLWLGPELEALAAGQPLKKLDMHTALQRLLPWPEAVYLEDLAPAHLVVPSGHRHAVDYESGRPVLRVKLQECFGLEESPRLCDIPVQFHLLSPAGRPLAVTDDLKSFWSGPYSQVRAEMRGRYPKHPWPEDPWSAPATARTKNRAR